MNVYIVRDTDWEDRIVEAPDFAKAVEAWGRWAVQQLKDDGDYEEGDDHPEPESVELIAREPVVRWVDYGAALNLVLQDGPQ